MLLLQWNHRKLVFYVCFYISEGGGENSLQPSQLKQIVRGWFEKWPVGCQIVRPNPPNWKCLTIRGYRIVYQNLSHRSTTKTKHLFSDIAGFLSKPLLYDQTIHMDDCLDLWRNIGQMPLHIHTHLFCTIDGEFAKSWCFESGREEKEPKFGPTITALCPLSPNWNSNFIWDLGRKVKYQSVFFFIKCTSK